MKTYINPSDYFRQVVAGHKSPLIGAEFEHLILHQDNRWVSNEEVAEILHDLVNDDWTMDSIEGVFLGLRHQHMWVSLEPGSQFEISIQPQRTVNELDELYREFINHCLPVIKAHGKKLVALGFQPINSPEDIQLIDKKRYHFMNQHFAETGSMGHYMMRASAATQVSVDYFDEADFRRKLQVASRIGPYLALMFDNVSYAHGQHLDESLFRTTIWLNTDDQRANLVEGGLEPDFGFDDYSRHILNFEPVVITEAGETLSTGHKKTNELFTPPINHDLWEHFLSMAFFDVRAKSYLEVRMIDSLPYPYNMAAVALIKGILYHPELERLADQLQSIDETKLFEIKQDLIEHGYESNIYGLVAKDLAKQLYQFAWEGLLPEERPLLEVMKSKIDRAENFHVPADVSLDENVKQSEVVL